MFTDWLSSSTYEQTLRVDGVHEQELNIANPSYPDPGNSSATPYTIHTGLDDNGDQIFNDRPLGVGRNTLRADAAFNISAFFSYIIPIGQKKLSNLPPGIMINGGPNGNFNVTTMQVDSLPRFRVGIQASVQNLTNHTNYIGYSGTMTSPFFGQPTAAQGMRKVDIAMTVAF